MTARLSRREREVVERIVAGELMKEIAFAMGISIPAVGTYAQRAYRKIGVASRRDLAPKPSMAANDSPEMVSDETERRRCRYRTIHAVRTGKLVKPPACSSCGRQLPRELIHAHHPDYRKPYDVTWLCPSCHASLHRSRMSGVVSSRSHVAFDRTPAHYAGQ